MTDVAPEVPAAAESTGAAENHAIYITYAALMTMAVLPIYFGSVASTHGLKLFFFFDSSA